MNYGTKIAGKFPQGEYKEGMTGMEYIRSAFNQFEDWQRPRLCQEKLDGWFGIVVRGEGDCFWDNGWGQYKELQLMLGGFNEVIPHNSILVGEVLYGTQKGTDFYYEHGYHKFVAYDLLAWDGVTYMGQDNLYRYRKLLDFVNPLRRSWLELVHCTILDSPSPMTNKQWAWDAFNAVIHEGGEGLILKDFHGLYIKNGKTTSMYKIKKFITKDYVCMGFTKSVAPTYLEKGLTVSSMECGLVCSDGVLRQVTQTSGFDEEWRKKFSEHPEQYIGRVVELGGFEVFSSGAMRHSSFLRFREDRTPSECVF